MVINPAIEDSSSVFANRRRNECLATRMLLDKTRNIMNNASDSNKGPAAFGFGNELIPIHYGELVEGNAPVKSRALLIELLLQLLDATFFNLILAELFQVVCKTELLPDPDGPFCRIVLPPFDRVTVVRWELVVEVMVPLSEGDDGG